MYINGEEVLSESQFTISEEMLKTSSTILNNCFPKAWDDDKDYVSKFYFPQDYSLCTIVEPQAEGEDQLIFAGVVKNSGDISLNPRYPHYCSLQILGFETFLSECETLDFVISNKTVTEAIEMIIDTIKPYGFELGTVNIFHAEDVIGAYSTVDKSPYDVFQYISDITGCRWRTRILEANKIAIDFYDTTLLPRADNIEYTTDYFEKNNIQDITFNYSTSDYRNKQIITSDQVYADIDSEEIVIADGYNTNFNLARNIGKIVEIKVNDVTKSFVTNADKEVGFVADFYYTPGESTIESNDTISSGSQIYIKYIALVAGRQIVYNNDEVNRINSQLGIKGVVARYENRNDTTSSLELNLIAQTYIKFKGHADITLTVKTYNKNLFEVGQVAYFEAPIEGLKQDYLVTKRNIQYLPQADYIFYEYELSSNFNCENAVNYFDNQRSKNAGNLSAGEYISRNIDIENTANIIFRNLTVREISGDVGTNILDCILDAPFNN